MTHPDRARAHPTKAFFVSMLTRDISLADAILDLVDNSLDGVLRVTAEPIDYSRFHVEVTLSASEFVVQDNCGGIPREVAANYAFKMGREPSDTRDDHIETIGMYGIGMKRAIFKMGRSSTVATRHGVDEFQVVIGSSWLSDPDWTDLPIVDVPADNALPEPGTRITVRDLNDGISARFAASDFEDELSKAMSDHFAWFLERGFTIKLNGESIRPTVVRVLFDADGPRPFYFEKQHGQTLIRVTVGINAPPPTDDDDTEDENTFADKRALLTAGWTILCNNRAVVVGDKTRLTGWGDGVPLFHPQFSLITGIVEFRAKHAKDLPITTTKRALDTSAESWSVARTIMRDGLTIFVQYTTRWKNVGREKQEPHWANAEPLPIDGVAEALRQQGSLKASRRFPGGHIHDPTDTLPKPKTTSSTNKRIVFSRPISEIHRVGEHLLDDRNAKPSMIGEACFERILKESRRR